MQYLKNFYSQLEQYREKWWPSPIRMPVALYDDESIYLYNHPKWPNEQSYIQLPSKEAWFGAETVTEFYGESTAIIYLPHHSSTASIFATAMHEMFHGLQLENGKKRWPDEMHGIRYPILAENIALRELERSHLQQAVYATDDNTRFHAVQQFIHYREQRKQVIGDFLDYETAVETIEGPAFYIEYYAYSFLSGLSLDDVLLTYSERFNDLMATNINLRKSNYTSGLFIALLLDHYETNWKNNYFKQESTLYEQLKAALPFSPHFTTEVQVTKQINNLVQDLQNKKNEFFEQFHKQPGQCIEWMGPIQLKGFDPMNIVQRNQQQLHKHFAMVACQNQSIPLHLPVLIHWDSKGHHIESLTFYTSSPLEVSSKGIEIEKIGHLPGSVSKTERGYRVLNKKVSNSKIIKEIKEQ